MAPGRCWEGYTAVSDGHRLPAADAGIVPNCCDLALSAMQSLRSHVVLPDGHMYPQHLPAQVILKPATLPSRRAKHHTHRSFLSQPKTDIDIETALPQYHLPTASSPAGQEARNDAGPSASSEHRHCCLYRYPFAIASVSIAWQVSALSHGLIRPRRRCRAESEGAVLCVHGLRSSPPSDECSFPRARPRQRQCPATQSFYLVSRPSFFFFSSTPHFFLTNTLSGHILCSFSQVSHLLLPLFSSSPLLFATMSGLV